MWQGRVPEIGGWSSERGPRVALTTDGYCSSVEHEYTRGSVPYHARLTVNSNRELDYAGRVDGSGLACEGGQRLDGERELTHR